MLLWTVATVALLGAGAGWLRAGRLARRLDALNQSYWELRYDYTRLRSQLARLDPGEAADEAAPPTSPGQVAFVSLASMKKKS